MSEHHDHLHGHSHGHRRRWGGWGSLWARARHVLIPHSHDSTDRVDAALRTSTRGMRTLVWSFVALFATALVQLVVVMLTGSVALLGDTIHNFADALTAVPIGIAFLLGRRVPTRRYTYGLGRAEDLAGVVVVLIIAASAAWVGYESVLRLIHTEPVTHLWAVALAGAIGFGGNEIVARYRITVGRQIGSAALVADGLHARTDGFTSLAVVLGALGVALGLPMADPLIGLGITVVILLVLRNAARDVFHRLMDAVDPADVALAEHTATQVPGVEAVGQLRMRWIGHSLHADLAVCVDPALTVEQAHQLAHQVEHELMHTVHRLTAAVVHTEPAADAETAHDPLSHHR